MRKLAFLSFMLLMANYGLNAQSDSLRMEREGGKVLVVHKVASKQTLFSLARRYGTTVDAINKENPALTNGLQVGQILKIPYGKAPLKEIPIVQDSTITMTVDTPEVEVIIPDPSDELSSASFKELLEEGIAELIEGGETTTKFLALHRTAPTGTVIKIRNTMNDLAVYVRVIGKLPDTGDNEKVIIKINKRTYDQLKALDNRFLVELSYFL
jgi:hypothetical protein